MCAWQMVSNTAADFPGPLPSRPWRFASGLSSWPWYRRKNTAQGVRSGCAQLLSTSYELRGLGQDSGMCVHQFLHVNLSHLVALKV